MPSPIGHSLAGVTIYLACNKEIWGRRALLLLILYVLVANLPDIDFIPGILIGSPGYFHHGITHTLGFAVLVTLACVFFTRLKKLKCRPICGIVFLLIFTHLIMDIFARDNLPPSGVMLFWPFSGTWFYSSFSVFTEINRDGIREVFGVSNIKAGLREFFIFMPLVLGLLYFRIRRRRRRV